MKNQQENTGAEPALLRRKSGVDTSETNSLCCAAGTITPSSATAETRIPHEKLRGAAKNAQERTLAQPDLGAKDQPLAHKLMAKTLEAA